MHDQTRVGHLGLSDNEVKVLKSIFSLSEEIRETCVLVESRDLATADLVLVDIDNPDAVKAWNSIYQSNRLAKPVTLSSRGNKVAGVNSLNRPIRLQNLVAVLDESIEHSTKVQFPDAADDLDDVLKILIVDDSYPVRNYMEQALSRLVKVPAQISFAESGEIALEKIERTFFDIVFLDVMMEGVDGYKVCKTIKASYSSYVIMLTSKKSPFDKVRGTMSGCDAYISKPPSDERLVEAIGAYVAQRDRMVS